MTSDLKKELNDQIKGQNDEYKEVIIQNETQKFVTIFDKVFAEKEHENDNDDDDDNLDAEDGLVEDILSAIINRIKAILKQKFVKKIIEEEENGENESSSETEA